MAQIRSQEVRDYVNSMNQQQRDALPANAIRDLTAWIEVRDAQEPDITPEGQPAPTAPANGQPVMRRRSFASRTWARLRGRPDQEYAPTGEMVDENGRHYRIVEEEIVYTDPENNRGMAAALLALGAAAVSGLVVYELTKGGGHVDSHQLNQILAQDKGLRHQVHDLSNQVSSFEKKNTLQHAHAHKHELQADQGLHNQIHRAAKHQDRLMNDLKGQITRGDRSQARSLKDIHDHLQDSGAYWGVRYPWDWAANKIGTLRAEGWLHKLAAKAAAHGHKVKWIMNRNGTESLKVDGSENTQKVLQIISQYK